MRDIHHKFTELIAENEGLIKKVCRIYTSSSYDRSDLFQEIVLQLLKAFPSFRGESKVSTWIYRVALNTAINFHHQEKRHRTIDVEIPDSPLPDHSEKKEQLGILYRVIETLGKMDKALIFLHLEGYRYDEISTMTGLTETNVATRISRIKKRITEKVNKIYSL